ncbi:MAG TPA: histone deacetylase, partial [Myxococcales bacterium]|nr:histone deacetylase [Myxococcales bacterium]
FRPAAFHTAYASRTQLRFVDPARQGRFEALVRDLAGMPLAAATGAVAKGLVLLDGAPYRWEPDEMVHWLRPRAEDPAEVTTVRDATHFMVAPGSPDSSRGASGG